MHTERSRFDLLVVFGWTARCVFVRRSLDDSCHGDRINYSTVTDFAKFLGLSTSVPRAHAV